MDFMQYRVKVMENFKDGNIMGGKFLKAEEVIMVSESDFVKITNSGGVLEILDTMIPNPKKQPVEVVEALLDQMEPDLDEEKAKAGELAQAEEKIYRKAIENKPKRVADEHASDNEEANTIRSTDLPKRKVGRPRKNES